MIGPELAYGWDERCHDTGDEDPGETTRRRSIKCERQAAKAQRFHWRMFAAGIAAPKGMADTGRRPYDPPMYVHGGSDGRFLRVPPEPSRPLSTTDAFAKFDYSAAELATLRSIALPMPNPSDKMLDRALAVILADGTPMHSLWIESTVGDLTHERRIMQTLDNTPPVFVIGEVTTGILRARVWTETSATDYKITCHYEGPPLQETP